MSERGGGKGVSDARMPLGLSIYPRYGYGWYGVEISGKERLVLYIMRGCSSGCLFICLLVLVVSLFCFVIVVVISRGNGRHCLEAVCRVGD